MANVKASFESALKPMKPMHGVGQPPIAGTDFSRFRYLKDAGIPFSRLHDVAGYFGEYRFVDVPNLFRDFDADENDPENYDFVFTDMLISALMESGVEPFFRLGVTIENFHAIKYYRLAPPKDFGKWARICEHVIRHYTEGWANGFHYPIRYWEIWNEPDDYYAEENAMWKGTKEQFYEFYTVAARHLKACFPLLKIGGYGACGFYRISGEKSQSKLEIEKKDYFLNFFHEILSRIKETGSTLDFFSFHSYDYPENIAEQAAYARRALDEAGFADTELFLTEWNCYSPARGTLRHASLTAHALVCFQNSPLDGAMFYDARFGIGQYAGMFNPETGKPYPAYYAFTAFNRLYKLHKQAEASCDDERICVLAAADGDRGALMLVNTTPDPLPFTLSLDREISHVLVTGDGLRDTEMPLPEEIEGYGIITVLCE